MKQTGMKDPNEAVRLVNSGEWTLTGPIRTWNEKDGLIRFSVTSDGGSGEEWISRLGSNGFRIGDYAKSVLRSRRFKPTNSITYEIAVLKGILFNDCNRLTKNIRKEAKFRKLITPNAEIACLIREKFSDQELKAMGLYWIVAMHEPIRDSDGSPELLGACRSGLGPWLHTVYDDPNNKWDHKYGFAFVISSSYIFSQIYGS